MSEAIPAKGALGRRRRSFAEWLEDLAMSAPPESARGPIFIGDCVTQLGGRPMLLILGDQERPGE